MNLRRVSEPKNIVHEVVIGTVDFTLFRAQDLGNIALAVDLAKLSHPTYRLHALR